MAAIGLLYLVFEGRLLARSAVRGDSKAAADNTLSRVFIGIQVLPPPKTEDSG